jgi:cell division protein FtsB
MRNLGGNQNKWRSVLQSRPVLVILFFVVLSFAWNVFEFWGKMSETRKNRQMVEAKVNQLQIEKERLTADISKLNTEEGVEDNIREKFGLAKEGEQLIVVVDDESEKDTTEEESSNWFTSFFKNLFK